jgi:polar amino acid transport system substrate-binding protein
MHFRVRNLLLACAILAVSAASASAQTLLEDIVKRGTINVGLAKLIARDLGVKVNIVDTVASARIPNLLSKKLDIVISSFSITAERAKVIAFTDCVYVDQQVLLAPKTSKFAGMADLKGHKIGVTRSTTNDIALTKNAVEGTTIQRYDDDASTSQALLAGQVEGIVTSRGLAMAMIGRDPKLDNMFVVASAPMGIGLRLGEPDMLHWLNTDIFMLWTTGDIQALQKKWMGAANTDLPRF